jgi:type I restriction enzyme S subunit
LYYWFIANKKVLENTANSAVVPILNNKTLQNIDFKFPNLPTQQKIAEILDTADQLRQYNKQLIEKYDGLTQSLFLDMFGDPVRNEKAWEKIRFDELVSKDCPLTYGIVQPGEEFENGIPCVRPVDLTSQYIKVDNLKKIDPKISSKFGRTLLKGGEILLSVRGSVGVISIADESLKNSNVTRGIVPIWFESSISNKLFFFHLYNTMEIQREIKSLAKGATLIQINLKDLREIKIIKPLISLQNQFAERVQMIETQKQQAQEALAKSEDLFQSLLQRAFKGELV